VTVLCILGFPVVSLPKRPQGFSVVLFALPPVTLSRKLPRPTAARTALWSARTERILVVGRLKLARPMIEQLGAHDVGYVVGMVGPSPADRRPFGGGPRHLGTLSELAVVVESNRIDRLVFVDERPCAEQQAQRLAWAKDRGLEASFAVSHYDAEITRELEAPRTRHGARWDDHLKRLLDLCVASSLLLALAPLIGLIALLVRMTSPGPAFYRCRRLGRKGRIFNCLKFRTMRLARAGTASKGSSLGSSFKIRNDPRVTSLGRILRTFSLDEVPQLVNVLRGEMSLVGPRPLRPADLRTAGRGECFRRWVETRSQVRPGLSGLCQISGRSDLSLDNLVELDLKYLQKRSLALDLLILAKTLPAAVSRSGAY